MYEPICFTESSSPKLPGIAGFSRWIPRPTESETLRGGPSSMCSSKPSGRGPGNFDACQSSRTTGIVDVIGLHFKMKFTGIHSVFSRV